MATLPTSSSRSSRSGWTAVMRARVNQALVRMPAWPAVSETAGQPRARSAMASSVAETVSPVESRRSSSRGSGSGVTERASAISSSVVLPIAETTTTTPWFWARLAATRSATARIRSAPATDVPPYF